MTNKNQFLSVIDDEIDIMSLFRDALLQIDLQLGFAKAGNRQNNRNSSVQEWQVKKDS